MLTFSRLFSIITLVVAVSAATNKILPPNSKGQSNPVDNTLSLDGTDTDTDSIVSTASVVDQKAGATDATPPGLPPNATVVTAVDGELTDAGKANSTARRSLVFGSGSGEVISRSASPSLSKRILDGWEQVFEGTGTGSGDRDGSIQGTAYLTYTVIPNSTYDIDTCLQFCANIEPCVFANLYYEFNNDLLDFVFHEHSNLKCAVYGDVHTADEKTNRGGQQLEAPPAGLTYIQQSSGFSSKALVDPPAPEGYELVFGPTNGANNAPGYMGFAFLDRYDVAACAQQCNTRGADGNGGACQYFNIWRAVVNGNPTTYTCSMYYIVADESSAVNTGQGDLKVTLSRGYKRKNLVIDGGFEGFNDCDDFCFTTSYANWIGSTGSFDAEFFHFQPYAHAGNGVALLGSGDDTDSNPGTITPAKPLLTVAGKKYTIAFFHNSAFSGPTLEAPAFVDVLWNGDIVSTIRPGFSQWTFFQFEVIAKGNDVLAFRGGAAPAWSFIDDVSVFEL